MNRIPLFLGSLLLGGCEKKCSGGGSSDSSSSSSGAVDAGSSIGVNGSEVPSGRGEIVDAGEDPSRQVDAYIEGEEALPSQCEPGRHYCNENIFWECLPGNNYEKIVDCESLICNPGRGCVQGYDGPYWCDTENQFVLNFHRGTAEQWSHIGEGGFSCEPLCPWDAGHDGQPLLFSQEQDSIYFEAPVCTNAKQVHIVLDARIPSRTGEEVLLKLPFRQEPYRLYFPPEKNCNSHVFAVADLESNADFESILRNGRLPITLELDDRRYGDYFEVIRRESLDSECSNFVSSSRFGLSRVTVISCYPDIKTPDGRSLSSCELPSCQEVGAFRCYENMLEECTQQGWVWREVCELPLHCNEEEGRCSEPPQPVETCGEPQEVLFHQGTVQEFEMVGSSSCDPLCPQFPDLTHQPLLYSGGRSFVSKSFQLPEGFRDPDKVYLDFTVKIAPNRSQQITVGEVEKGVEFQHSCAPIRSSFTKEEGLIAENGLLNVRINSSSGEGVNERHDLYGDGRECRGWSFNSGIVALSMTPCNIEYR